ncbi:MAG TPA: zf-HC2 domain-containing protein [Pyrinomonadaceae bacterium]
MNCKQLDELLPLYAGHDLDEKRARLVSEHVQICSACARVAGEYQDAVELAPHFAPPVFSDNVYASVRRQVMQQIEDEPTAPLLPQMFASWFRPRLTWAVASALIIAFGFFALYLVVNRGAEVRPVADNHPTVTEQPRSIATPSTITAAGSGITGTPPKDQRRSIRSFGNRSPLVAAKARNLSSAAASVSPKLRDPEAGDNLPSEDAVADKSPLRVEMQTKDPNIRIIWFLN